MRLIFQNFPLLLAGCLNYFVKYELLRWEIGSTLDNFEVYRTCLVSAGDADVEECVALLVSVYQYYPEGSRIGYSEAVTPVVRVGRTITVESLIKIIADKTGEAPWNGIRDGEYDEREYIEYWVEKYGRNDNKIRFENYMKNESLNP